MISTSQILQQIKRSVSVTDPDATLILYGSYARGDQREDSDIDILVLVNKDKITYDDRKRIGNPLNHLELEVGIVISPMILSRKSWETKHTISGFFKNVAKEGKVL